MTARDSTPACWETAKAMGRRMLALCRTYARAAVLALARMA